MDVTETYLLGSGMHAKVARDCDGLKAVAILTAGILAFPASWRARLIGLGLGWVALSLINIFRIVVLFLLGVASDQLFEIVHVYVFQAFIVAAAVGCFLWWAHAVTTGRLAPAAPGREVRG